MKNAVAISLILLLAISATPSHGQQASKTAGKAMKKYVTEQATFVLCMPEGWKASEGDQGKFKTLIVNDPSGLYSAAMFYGSSPTGKDVLTVASFFANNIRKQLPDLNIVKVLTSPDRKKVVFDAIYTDRQKKKKEFRVWVTGGHGNFTYSSIEAPEGQLTGSKQLLLTILSNVQIMKGAIGSTQAGSAPVRVTLVLCRLHDGSASFQIPQG